jgi:hypothetical protein
MDSASTSFAPTALAPEKVDINDTNILAQLNQLAQLIYTSIQHNIGLKDALLAINVDQFFSYTENPLNKFGHKCFSQNDEDGITIEVCRRLGLTAGTYAEFGVGDGKENNTLILAALGFRGFWVGGSEVFRADKPGIFEFKKSWITLDNIHSTARDAMASLNIAELDIVSLDLDGNDYYLVDNLLKNRINPKVFILEYNARFPPPVKFKIDYNPNHRWEGDDYFGASLSTLEELLGLGGYSLVCCNSTGNNAFFVRNDFMKHFDDVPRGAQHLFVPSRHFLYRQPNNPLSEKTLATMFR